MFKRRSAPGLSLRLNPDIVADVPNIKAADKWVRQTAKRRVRNLDAKTRLKTLFKKAADQGEPSGARSVEGQFDKAASKGIIHKNKAARKKSRLAKAVNAKAASAQTAAPVKPAKRTTKKTTAK
jgi:small subunit ribosomal protein S20